MHRVTAVIRRTTSTSSGWRDRRALAGGALAFAAVRDLGGGGRGARRVAQGCRVRARASSGAAIGPFLYLGAKHMVTGYDHLLFLVGVIFFLYRLKDVIQYVSLFTIGHSLTLLVGVLGGMHANAYIVDAIIGLSVVYKGFENVGGFKAFLGWQPNTKAAVMIFGLFHGFGLATKLQELALTDEGLVTNIVSFNVGVEIGQMLALTGDPDRAHLLADAGPASSRHAFLTNALLMFGGFLLIGYQLSGYMLAA